MIFRYIPLMGIVFVIYAVITLTNPAAVWSHSVAQFTLPSGGMINLTVSYLFIAFALFVLFIEIVKSTSSSPQAMVEQALSALVFVFYLLSFLLFSFAAEATFFILMIISFVELLAGFIIMTVVARRDVSIGV